MGAFDLDKMNSRVVPDPFTGGNQTEYWNDEGTFFMTIPDRAIPLPPGYKPQKVKWTDNEDGSKSWEIIQTDK